MSGWAGFWIGLFVYAAVEDYIHFQKQKEMGIFKKGKEELKRRWWWFL